MRKIGTILSPECKVYAKDISEITGVDEYINLQYLRLIENLVCQRICEEVLTIKKEDRAFDPISVEIPLMGNLIITQQQDSNKLFTFEFDPLPTFKKHVQNIYNNNSCELISLLSDIYAKKLVETYNDILGEF